MNFCFKNSKALTQCKRPASLCLPPQHHRLQNDVPSLFRSCLHGMENIVLNSFSSFYTYILKKKKKKKSTFHLASSLLYKLSDKSANFNLGLRKSDMISL